MRNGSMLTLQKSPPPRERLVFPRPGLLLNEQLDVISDIARYNQIFGHYPLTLRRKGRIQELLEIRPYTEVVLERYRVLKSGVRVKIQPRNPVSKKASSPLLQRLRCPQRAKPRSSRTIPQG